MNLTLQEVDAFLDYECVLQGASLQRNHLVFLIPPVVGQEEVKGPSSGSSEVLGEIVKLLECFLVPVTKEQIDGSTFLWILDLSHMIRFSCGTI